jgi:hypothetical protein
MAKVKLNDYGRRRRLGGKHFGASISATPMTVDFDEQRLAAEVAPSLRDEIEAGIRGITKKAKPSTLKRSKARRSPTLFNATGHLASSLGLAQDGDAVAITAPGDRLQDEKAVLLERLRELVPVLDDGQKLLKAKRVREAQIKAAKGMHSTGSRGTR